MSVAAAGQKRLEGACCPENNPGVPGFAWKKSIICSGKKTGYNDEGVIGKL